MSELKRGGPEGTGWVVCLSIMATGLIAEAAAAREQPASAGNLEEIVVTSRRITEKLQDVPLSISAFTAESLTRSHIEELDDLRMKVPGLNSIETPVGVPSFIIRGIGSGGAVGVFLDDVYLSRAGGASADFLDVERVEVLRGPQGTLLGRNVVGGAVALFSKKPTHDFGWSAATNIGNYDRYDAEGILNTPITDRMAARFAVSRKSYGGHSYNQHTGNHLDNQDRYSARASFLFEPSDTLSVVLRSEYGHADERARWWDLAAVGPLSRDGRFINPDPRSGRNMEDGYSRLENWNVTGSVEWDSGIGHLTSTTSYRDAKFSTRENQIGKVTLGLTDPARFTEFHTLFVPYGDNDAAQYSQELRLSGKPVERLQLVGGVYYLHEDVDRSSFIKSRFLFFNVDADGGGIGHSELDSYAAYGQAQYSFTDRWQLTGGIRWTEDQREVQSHTVGTTQGGFRDENNRVVPGWSASSEADWSAVTPMASLSYHPTQNLNFFATVSRGFKSGGFAEVSSSLRNITTPFNPEYAWDYELGFKSELFDRKLRLNANLFYIDYTDLQLVVVRLLDPNLPPFSVTSNAGKAEVSGVELDWEWALTRDVRFYGSYAYNRSELQDIVINNVDASGNRLLHSPKNKLAAGVAYSIPTAAGTWTVRGEASYQDDMFGDLANSPLTVINGYTLVDAGLGWVSSSGRLQLELWGKNLTDELYWTNATEIPLQDVYVKYGAPRTYGITARYHYD